MSIFCFFKNVFCTVELSRLLQFVQSGLLRLADTLPRTLSQYLEKNCF